MLSLAARLGELTDESALSRLRARTFNPQKINDAFDLAEALLSTESITTALHARSRTELAVLRALSLSPGATRAELGEACNLDQAALDAILERLEELFLITHTEPPRIYAEVANCLDVAGVPALADLSGTAEPVALAEHPVDTRLIDRWAGDAAVRASVALSELIWTLREEPARELVKGGVALPDLKRLAAAAGRELAEIEPLLQLARAAGLVAVLDSDVVASSEAEVWLDRSLAERWLQVVESWWPKQSRELRAAARHTLSLPASDEPWRNRLTESLHWLFPALEASERVRSVKSFEAAAQLLGLVVSGELTELGRLSLGEPTALRQRAAELFPPHISAIYVQPDLSIIAPGPLEPELERGLRDFCVMERADLAASLRLSVASVNRALARGRSVSDMRALLERLADGELPQPVRYLLEDAAARFGRVRVREAGVDALPALSLVHASEPQLLATIAADQSLSVLGFVRTGEALSSRASARTVLWALTAERYPAVLEDAAGSVVSAAAAPRYEAGVASADPVAAAWSRVRERANAQSSPDAFIERQIEQAIRAKTTLRVTVSLPSGESKTYLLAPGGLANGRVRGRDTASEIERTLPLSSITAVESN